MSEGTLLATTILNSVTLDLRRNGIWNNLILWSYTMLNESNVYNEEGRWSLGPAGYALERSSEAVVGQSIRILNFASQGFRHCSSHEAGGVKIKMTFFDNFENCFHITADNSAVVDLSHSYLFPWLNCHYILQQAKQTSEEARTSCGLKNEHLSARGRSELLYCWSIMK